MPPLRRHSLIMSYYSFIEHGLLTDFTVGVLISASQSGATKQQLTGIALTKFITEKSGVGWISLDFVLFSAFTGIISFKGA